MKIKGLTIIAILCLGLFALINFCNFKFEEIYIGTAQKSEYFIETISLSYLSGYIFYFINIYLVEKNERKIILPFIARNVNLIIINNHSIINCLKNDAKLSVDFYPAKEEYKELLKKVNPKSKSPFYYQNESWTYLFKNRQSSTQEIINRIFLSGKHVDEELRRILLEINYSLYLKDDYAFNSVDFNKNNLEDYHLVFSNYFELIKKLKIYYDKNLKKL
jgi:hypothetical protein